ncbi:conserved hypothetical protein [Talaromyces marneffei ATCC 18224]|uniref:Mp1p-like protein 13 n=1 Tax=Talaromyces marneffei (strain ATCC 18224 / CBS 334.59 / QM 7333) TaxID=441960 RepID=B6Q6U3_TALMQ|nr:conserved hypothetical protein [Talaromyces marneffei ATCC 18224]
MKLLPSLILLSLSAQALASPYINHYTTKDQRDLSTYKSVIQNILTTVVKFGQDIVLNTSHLNNDFDNIIDAIAQGTKKLEPEAPLNYFQAGVLLIPIIPVNKAIHMALQSLINRRDILVAAVKFSLRRYTQSYTEIIDDITEAINVYSKVVGATSHNT